MTAGRIGGLVSLHAIATATGRAPDRPGAGRELLQRYEGDWTQLLVPREYKAVELYTAIGA
jgi:hypothetical protein